MEKIIKHISHLHPLTLCMLSDQGADDHKEPLLCFVCGSYIRGPTYNCKICQQFWLHKSCAELLQEKKNHPFHSAHSLFFQSFETEFICDGCQELCFEQFYVCEWCRFFLCIKCACFTYEEEEASKGAQAKTTIQHFSHGHPLTRCNVRSRVEGLSELSCVACKEVLSGPTYFCQCGIFYSRTFKLHESCLSDMPQEEELEHPFHPQHHLWPQSQSLDAGDFKICNACHEKIWGINFSCVGCSFYMHASCVKYKTRAIKHHTHEHDLFYFGPRHIGRCRKCHFCGESCSAFFFCCVICQFDIHIECLPLPLLVKHNRHFHPLMLKDSVIDDLGEHYCEICETERNSEHHVYYCEECNFTAHIDCVISQVESPEKILSYLVPRTKKVELEERSVQRELKTSDSKAKEESGKDISTEKVEMIEPNDEDWVLSDLDEEIKNLQEEVEKLTAKIGLDPSSLLPSPKLARKIQHFSHKHSLIFCMLSGQNCLCNSCGYEIHGSAYACEELCDFHLHRSCSELPKEIEKHSLHPTHSLLFQNNDPYQTDYTICDGCQQVFVGQKYICRLCRVSFDIKCALLTDEEAVALKGRVHTNNTVLHFSHEHHLTHCCISDKLTLRCNGCKAIILSATYACVDCQFFLHESCFNDMPQEVETPFHPQHHLLPLLPVYPISTYPATCCACNTIIKGLMFQCSDCRFVLHVSCAKYKARAIKHEYHEHDLLYFGPRNIGRCPYCDSCRKLCETSFFCCMICNFDIHLECLPLPLTVKHKRHFHPLTLRDLIVEDDSGGYYCDICETERNPEHHVYYCEECNYIAHIDCVISQVEPPEKILSYMVPPTENIESKDENDEIESIICDSEAKEGSSTEDLVHRARGRNRKSSRRGRSINWKLRVGTSKAK